MTVHHPTGPRPPGGAEGLFPVDRVLRDLHERIGAEEITGSPADYIPELALADPESFGIALATVQGDVREVGDTTIPFTIQSISKIVLYGMALEDRGPDAVAELVGVEPSGEAFNSIRLHPQRSTPLNPMVNAGAIATTGMVLGTSPDDRLGRILATFEAYTGSPARVDERVYRSESESGHRNRAIAHLLRNFSVIDDDPDHVLEVYFQQCSILVTCRDIAVMGATLANRGVNPLTGARALAEAHVPSVLSVMATCGMYDFAGQWLHDIGLPAKSGVAGGIMAVLPGQLGIGTFSPPLDGFGNSVRGIRVCRVLSGELDLHLLNPPRHGVVARGRGAPSHAGSRRQRPRDATAALLAAGDRVLLHRPQGDITFTAAVTTARTLVECGAPGGYIVLDLSDVHRLDGAAATIIAAVGETLAARDVDLLVCGTAGHTRLLDEIERRRAVGDPATIDLWGDAEEALEWCEDQVLADLGIVDGDATVALEASDLCRRMSPEEVAELRAAVETVAFAAGELMMVEGAPSDHLLVISSGRASAMTTRADGSRVRVVSIGPGMFGGEMGLIDGGTRSATVVADTPVVAYRLTRAALEGLADDAERHTRSVLLLNIAESLSGYLRRATALMADGRA